MTLTPYGKLLTGWSCGMPHRSASAAGWVPLQEPVGWLAWEEAPERLSAEGIPCFANACQTGRFSTRLDGDENGCQQCYSRGSAGVILPSCFEVLGLKVSFWQSGQNIFFFWSNSLQYDICVSSKILYLLRRFCVLFKFINRRLKMVTYI